MTKKDKCLETLKKIKKIEDIEYQEFYSFDFNKFGIIPLDKNGELMKNGEKALLNRLGIYTIIKSTHDTYFLIIDEKDELLFINVFDYLKRFK